MKKIGRWCSDTPMVRSTRHLSLHTNYPKLEIYEKAERKREIDCNELFLEFPQCFSFHWIEDFPPFLPYVIHHVKMDLMWIAKSIDPGQPVQSAQADHSRKFTELLDFLCIKWKFYLTKRSFSNYRTVSACACYVPVFLAMLLWVQSGILKILYRMLFKTEGSRPY